jgi:hypothetical protein
MNISIRGMRRLPWRAPVQLPVEPPLQLQGTASQPQENWIFDGTAEEDAEEV